ncbi:Uncharacterised protein [Sphingobacterium spiritivorum]|uniref:Uncharacterized protein n=1 Tax=Sphingobacterium spiritivorum ATCC 33861 TaxID=525373 RepID=D7VQI0_SPHSI|nr:hypothetical protein HMPREF0766_13234 [Sphingobacterium spiritivorum ATCC 33861]SUJ11107.1 Uncharacterised protein [Sphingobacterium spiritivorum]
MHIISNLWPLFNLALIVFIIFIVYYLALVFTKRFLKLYQERNEYLKEIADHLKVISNKK